jgi:hypothetical protein
MEFLRCGLCSHGFKYENPLNHPITLPKSGLTMCRHCIGIIHDETKCPHDHLSVAMNYTSIDQLPRSIVPTTGSRRIFRERCGKVTGSCFQLPSIFRRILVVSRRTSFTWIPTNYLLLVILYDRSQVNIINIK